MAREPAAYIVLGYLFRDWDRLEDMVEIRRSEGGAAYLATLDSKPCFAINEAALDDGDEGGNFTPIYLFESVEARDEYVTEFMKPLLRADLEHALISEFRSGKLSRDDLEEGLRTIEKAYRG